MDGTFSRLPEIAQRHGRARVLFIRALPTRGLPHSVGKPLRRTGAGEPHHEGVARGWRSSRHAADDHRIESFLSGKRNLSGYFRRLWLADYVGSFLDGGGKGLY